MNTETTSEILVKWYKLTFVVDRKPGYVHMNTDIFENFYTTRNRRRNITVQSPVVDPGGESGIPPPPPYQTWRLFETEILTYHLFTGWFFFNETRIAFCH